MEISVSKVSFISCPSRLYLLNSVFLEDAIAKSANSIAVSLSFATI
jgi:hypothetical protein